MVWHQLFVNAARNDHIDLGWSVYIMSTKSNVANQFQLAVAVAKATKLIHAIHPLFLLIHFFTHFTSHIP